MVKTLCIGMTAAAYLAIAIAADAADLSMTPIYQTRPSAAATPNWAARERCLRLPLSGRATAGSNPPVRGPSIVFLQAFPYTPTMP